MAGFSYLSQLHSLYTIHSIKYIIQALYTYTTIRVEISELRSNSATKCVRADKPHKNTFIADILDLTDPYGKYLFTYEVAICCQFNEVVTKISYHRVEGN